MLETTEEKSTTKAITFRVSVDDRNRFFALVKGSGRDVTDVLADYVVEFNQQGGTGTARSPSTASASASEPTSGRAVARLVDELLAKLSGVRVVENALRFFRSFEHLTPEQREDLARLAAPENRVVLERTLRHFSGGSERQRRARAAS